MLMGLLLFGLVVLLVYYIYKNGTANEDFFHNSGLKYIKPVFIMGNSSSLFFKKYGIYEYIKFYYDKFPGEAAYGMFDLRKPVLFVKDVELIKQLTVKEFDHFADHRVFVDDKMDTLFGNSLVSLNGQKWRDMRATLSPAFTGSKMRQMFNLIVEVSDQMVSKLVKDVKDNQGMMEYEMKDLCSKYTNDVIALCAFGHKVNTLENDKNEFFMTGKSLMDFGKWARVWKLLAFRLCPNVMTYFKIQLFSDVSEFFRSIITNTMNYREEKKIIRPDMINMLMEMRKGNLTHKEGEEESDSIGFATVTESEVGRKSHKRKWSDDEIIAQCFLFFAAGFDTSSTMMSFTIYELTLNPEIQDKLYEEVKEVNDSLEGKPLTYEILQKMKYLDMVTSESLRKHPPAAVTDRTCVKDLDYKGKNFSYKFTKDIGIFIPIYGIHRDEKYFPNPDKFDPERFSDENKHSINQDAYMPFGVGPRNCIGSRFALMEVKALLYYLVLNFSFNAVERTQVPLVLKKSFGSVQAENGIWVGFKPRESL